MKSEVVETALNFPAMRAKDIARTITTKYDSLTADPNAPPAALYSRKQLQTMVYDARGKEHVDWMSAISSAPLNKCTVNTRGPDFKYESDKLFLQFNVQANIDGELQRIIGWANHELMYQLRHGKTNYFLDGTFDECPPEFTQTLVLMAYLNAPKMYVPVFYVLMQSKKEAAYTMALQHMMAACGGEIKPSTFTCDYETSILNSIKTVFPKAVLIPCLFHWKQALVRKMIALGIPKNIAYELCNSTGHINLLTVIKSEEIVPYGIPFIQMKCAIYGTEYKAAFDEFWQYFMNTWVRNYGLHMFNVYHIQGTDLQELVINRTNNPLERFNRALHEEFPKKHPSMATYVETIKYVSAKYAIDIKQVSQNPNTMVPNHQAVPYSDVPNEYYNYLVEKKHGK